MFLVVGMYSLDRCCFVSVSGLSSWKTVKEDSRPFFLLPYVAIRAFSRLNWTVTLMKLRCKSVKVKYQQCLELEH